jgi:hypothetical protein
MGRFRLDRVCTNHVIYVCKFVLIIHFVLIDQQSVGKTSLHLMETVNAKKRWTTVYWRVNKFLKKSHEVTCLAKAIIYVN